MKVESFVSQSPSALEGQMIDFFKDGFRPTLGFVFCSPAQNHAEIGRIFNAFGVQLLGCTTAGEIVNDELYETSIVAMLLEIDKAYFKTAIVGNTEGVIPTARFARRFAESAFDNPAIIICSCGVFNDGEAIVEGLTQYSNREIPIFGGLAGDDLNIKTTTVFSQEETITDGLGVVVFDGDKIEIKGLATSGWRPLGTYHTVTKAEGNVIHTINNTPALDFFIRFFGEHENANVKGKPISTISAQYPFQIKRDDGYSVLRSPIYGDEVERTLRLVGSIKQGDQFRFSISPGPEVIEDTVNEFVKFSEKVPEADALLLFSCKGRHAALGPFLVDEIEGIYKTWLKPMIGFLSYGEIGSVHNGTCEFHNETCSLVLIKEK
ncbi:MAG: FIST C-terminal domain-containing protein [Saprospiraceae bacterium]|nr:FIST C-terminal domain-containing protein [Saprospiraceae bacterium]